MSLAWSTAARGARVIPCVLIAGLPVILIPEGVTLTGWSAGGLDAAWWPGSSFSGFSAYLKPWLSLAQPLAWNERAQPVQPEMLDVGAVDIRVSDIGLRADGTGGLATAIFGARDSVTGTWITADVTTTTYAVNVASTAGFASTGFLYVGRETMAYTSLTSTSFVVGSAANRGKFGSPVQHHWYVGNGNAAIANPEVTTGAPEIIGRTATVWLLEVSAAGVVTAGELAFYGTVGAGVVLSEDGEAWTLRLDHLIKRLGIPLRGETVAVTGFVHNAPAGNRGLASLSPPRSTIARLYCPTYDFSVDANGSVIRIWTLTAAAAAPDNGGWHADAASYVRDLNIAAAGTAIYELRGDNFLRVATNITVGVDALVIGWPWATGADATTITEPNYVSDKPFPGAWVPVFAGSRIYLTAGDYALIPATPSSAIATVYYAVAIEGDDDVTRYARITGRASSGSLYWITVDALMRDEAQMDRLGLLGLGFIVEKPTSARVVCYVQAADWVSAIEAVIVSFDTSLGETLADSFDFNDMRDVVARYPVGPYGSAREYVVDLGESVLSLLTRECRLNGFTLVLRAGRITLARFADFAPTEITEGSIATADLHADYPRPQYSRGMDGIVNAVSFSAPEPIDITVNVVDATSLSRYGAGRTRLEAQAPQQITGTVVNPAAEYLRLAAQAMQVLGPMRYPYEYVTVTTPLHKLGLAPGSLVALSLWRVPNQLEARNLTSRMGQVMGRDAALYDEGDGRVTYTVRLSPTRIQGWAPSALVAGAGISGANVTLDTTTFGAAGFAPTGTDGGASWFEIGEAVRLVQIGTTTPTTSTQHTVGGVSGAVLTLSPAPNATFTGLSGTPLTVMVVADDWSVVTANQQQFAYIADTSYRLDVNTAARTYAA